MHVSSHRGDGRAGQAVIILTPDVNAVFRTLTAARLDQSHRTESPVHLGPVKQSWGTVEYYVDDPWGNRLIFAERG